MLAISGFTEHHTVHWYLGILPNLAVCSSEDTQVETPVSHFINPMNFLAIGDKIEGPKYQ